MTLDDFFFVKFIFNLCENLLGFVLISKVNALVEGGACDGK